MEEAKIVFTFEDRSVGGSPSGGGSSGGGANAPSGTTGGGNSQRFHDELGQPGGSPGNRVPPPSQSKPPVPSRDTLPIPSDKDTAIDVEARHWSGYETGVSEGILDVDIARDIEAFDPENAAELVKRFLKESGGETALQKIGAGKAVDAFGKLGDALAKIPGAPQIPVPSAGVVSSLAAAAGPAAAILAIGAATAKTLDVSTRLAISELDRAEKEIGTFSPEVNQARVQEVMSQLRRRMNTAEVLGDEVAENIRNRARIGESVGGLRDAAVEPFLQEFNEISRILADILDVLNNSFARDLVNWQAKIIAESISQVLIGPHMSELVRSWATISKMIDKEEVDMFTYFEKQPHLPPPAPFADSGETPTEYKVGGVPGLTF